MATRHSSPWWVLMACVLAVLALAAFAVPALAQAPPALPAGAGEPPEVTSEVVRESPHAMAVLSASKSSLNQGVAASHGYSCARHYGSVLDGTFQSFTRWCYDGNNIVGEPIQLGKGGRSTHSSLGDWEISRQSHNRSIDTISGGFGQSSHTDRAKADIREVWVLYAEVNGIRQAVYTKIVTYNVTITKTQHGSGNTS